MLLCESGCRNSEEEDVGSSSSYESSEGEGEIVEHIIGKLTVGKEHPMPSNVRVTAGTLMGSYSLDLKLFAWSERH